MSISRVDSTFIIGFEQLKQQLELLDNAEPHKNLQRGLDKTLTIKKSSKESHLAETENFRSMTEHKTSLDDLASILDTNLTNGLSEDQAQLKLRVFGPNKLTEKKSLPWYCMFLKALFSWFSILLWTGSSFCFIAYGLSPDPANLYLGIVLSCVVFLGSSFNFYQESKSSAIMAGFKNMIPPVTIVIRDGQEKELKSANLVPGDVVMLKLGARIPADVRILEANNLKVDNSSLTGESEPQERKVKCTNEKSPLETKNLAFFGTSVFQGTGKGVVINTGDKTVIGCIAKLANVADSAETTLGIEISRFIRMISCIAFGFGLVFFITGLIIGYDIATNMVNTIGIIVANVPEGLMITLTISLTITSKKMAKKNVLVKNLQSVETLGSTTCICSDKTGTLTENKMTLVALWYDLKPREVVNYERRNEVEDLGYNKNDETFKMLQICATLNNKTKWNFSPDQDMLQNADGSHLPESEALKIIEDYKRKILQTSIKGWPVMGGDASETAMIKFFHLISDIDLVREKYPILVRDTIKGEIPFNSAYKYAVTLHEPVDFATETHDQDCVMFMKGAPEQIWNRCDRIMIKGSICKITESHKDDFIQINRQYGGQGRRVLGFAMNWLSASEYPPDYPFNPTLKNGPNFPLTGLIFLGLCALEDPPKLRVKEAVESCHSAGVKVIMVTGDQPLTAAAIARQVSIITVPKTVNELAEERGVDYLEILDESDAIVVHGDELSKFMEEDKNLPFEQQRIASILQKKEIVFARTSPAQKFMIVDCNQKLKHIVAVTGDGVNDSPAIKKADVGIAMAIVGSDVAKDAADMILMDDNFASIVDGIEEGRKIFDNLGKSIAYALTPNTPELLPFLALVIFQIPVPLSPVLMIIICLGTDMWPAISLAYEYPELDIMFRKPRNADLDHLVTLKLICFSYMQMGVIQAMAGFMAYFTVMFDYGFHPRTLWFLAFSTDGTRPGLNDTYAPYSKYHGNTNVGISTEDGAKVNWTGTGDAIYDLRIWFWKVNDWPECRYPEDRSSVGEYKVCYTTEALKYAQFAYFLAVIAVQWANVIVIKTKRVSIFEHGLRNMVSWHGILFETLLGIFIGLCPGLDTGFGGRRLHILHWFVPALPFFMLVLVFNECRKLIIRVQSDRNESKGNGKVAWVERNTLYEYSILNNSQILFSEF